MSRIVLLERWIEAANQRPKVWLLALVVSLAVQISPWLYPAVDGCLYLRTVRDFLSAESWGDFSCYVPPGYLPFLAPAFLFGERPFLAIAILQWLMAVALIGGLYVWARRQFPATAVLFTALAMVNISMWTYYRRPLKEVAAMAILMWTVNLMHVLLGERSPRRVVAFTAAAALLTAYMTLIRYSAITVAVGFAIAAMLQARRGAFGWRRAFAMSSAIGLTAALALCGWLYYDSTHGGDAQYWHRVTGIYGAEHDVPRSLSVEVPPSSYPIVAVTAGGRAAVRHVAPHPAPESTTDSHTELSVFAPLRHFVHGLLYRVNDVGCLLVPGLWKSTVPPKPALTVPLAVFFVLCAVIAFGWGKVVSRKLDILALTLPVYVLLYVHWDCDQPGGRFMLPMLPIIIACCWYGIGAFARRPMVIFGVLLALHLGQSTAYWLLIDAPRAYHIHQNWHVMEQVAETIRRDPGQVAVADEIQSECQALWYELEWGYRIRGLNQGIGPRVTWIVDETGSPPITGFSVCRVDGRLQLLHRHLPRSADVPVGKSDVSSTEIAGNP